MISECLSVFDNLTCASSTTEKCLKPDLERSQVLLKNEEIKIVAYI